MKKKYNRVVCLDGLRGVAALWVLIGHCMLLTGFSVPVFKRPDLGVDLFILLSGFLMVFQYQLRRGREDWDSWRTWVAFWIRRFFRLSPLYFLLLIVALNVGSHLYTDRMLIDHFLGRPPQSSSRYEDNGFTNFFFHLTYLFGIMPTYAFRTPLPDWSLGLEMQFYALFPFIILMARRFGMVRASIAMFCISGVIVLIAHVSKITYPMPSFLPLKLPLFLAGMIIAHDHAGERQKLLKHFLLVVLLTALSVGTGLEISSLVVRVALSVGFFGLVHWRSIGIVDRISCLLGSKPLFWLGELSYGTYLIHLLVLQPTAALMIGRFGEQFGAASRFTVVILATAVISYSLSFVGYILVERPGQALGRHLLGFLGQRRGAVETSAEEIAAP